MSGNGTPSETNGGEAPREHETPEETAPEEDVLAAYQRPPILEATNLSKWYGDVIALNDVAFRIEPGITGLLGPNGAGKSTLVKLATGLVRPSAGSVQVLGEDPWNNAALARRVGIVPEVEPPWQDMAVGKAVRFHGRLGGLDADEADAAAERALAAVSLEDRQDKRVDTLSLGQRQRLKFALALLHDPELLLLDEPLRGTDAVTRRELIELVRAMPEQGKSVIVSTHVLEELEAMTERILLLHHGRLYAHGTVSEVRALLDRFPRRVLVGTSDTRETGAAIWRLPSVLAVEALEGGVVARTHDPTAFYGELQRAVLDGQLPITSVRALDEDVSSIFQYLVGS